MLCIACFAGYNIPAYTNFAAIIKYATQHNARIKAYYVTPIDLQHYGHVEMLAPAGASSDFIEYTQGLNKEEANKAFAPLQAIMKPLGLDLPLAVLYGQKGVIECIQHLQQQEQNLCIYPKELLPPA